MLVNKINASVPYLINRKNSFVKDSVNLERQPLRDTVTFKSSPFYFENINPNLKNAIKNAALAGNDYEVFRILGMKPKILPDKTISLKQFRAFQNGIKFKEFGVIEQKLMANVSEILGDADFSEMLCYAIPKLKFVGGNLKLGNKCMFFPCLEEVKGSITSQAYYKRELFSMPVLKRSGSIDASEFNNLDSYEECTEVFSVKNSFMDKVFKNLKKTNVLIIDNSDWVYYKDEYKDLLGKCLFPALEEISYAMRYDTGEGVEMPSLKRFDGRIVYDMEATFPKWGDFDFKGQISKKVPFNHN
ncbi:hypothetical protein IJD34_05745 [bacterium]|nr:hypothetical protein [bacterium]